MECLYRDCSALWQDTKKCIYLFILEGVALNYTDNHYFIPCLSPPGRWNDKHLLPPIEKEDKYTQMKERGQVPSFHFLPIGGFFHFFFFNQGDKQSCQVHKAPCLAVSPNQIQTDPKASYGPWRSGSLLPAFLWGKLDQDFSNMLVSSPKLSVSKRYLGKPEVSLNDSFPWLTPK